MFFGSNLGPIVETQTIWDPIHLYEIIDIIQRPLSVFS